MSEKPAFTPGSPTVLWLPQEHLQKVNAKGECIPLISVFTSEEINRYWSVAGVSEDLLADADQCAPVGTRALNQGKKSVCSGNFGTARKETRSYKKKTNTALSAGGFHFRQAAVETGSKLIQWEYNPFRSHLYPCLIFFQTATDTKTSLCVCWKWEEVLLA